MDPEFDGESVSRAGRKRKANPRYSNDSWDDDNNVQQILKGEDGEEFFIHQPTARETISQDAGQLQAVSIPTDIPSSHFSFNATQGVLDNQFQWMHSSSVITPRVQPRFFRSKPPITFVSLPYRQQEWVCFAEIIPLEFGLEWFPDELCNTQAGKKMRPRPLPLGGAEYSISSEGNELSSKKSRPKIPFEQKEDFKFKKTVDREALAVQRAKQKLVEKKRGAYRQFWLASVKFPIDDLLLMSVKGIRRLGLPSEAARNVARPDNMIPAVLASEFASCYEDVFFLWSFLQCFSHQLRLSRFSLHAFVESLHCKDSTLLFSEILFCLVSFLVPEVSHSVEEILLSEQTEETNFIKSIGTKAWNFRRKLQILVKNFKFELLLCKFVFSFLHLENSTCWFFAVFICRFVCGSEKVDMRKEFFSSAFAFEEDEEDQNGAGNSSPWELDNFVLEMDLHALDFASSGMHIRVKILQILVDRLLSSLVFKKFVDISSDASLRITAELSNIEKEDRKINQRIASLQRLLAEGGSGAEDVDFDEVNTQLAADSQALIKLTRRQKITESVLNDKYSLALAPLGEDRHLNEYFHLFFWENLVIVKLKKQKNFGFFTFENSIENLICSMDVRGFREEKLKKELEKVHGHHHHSHNEPGNLSESVGSEMESLHCFSSSFPDSTAFNYVNVEGKKPADEPEMEEDDSFWIDSLEDDVLRKTLNTAAESVRLVRRVWLSLDTRKNRKNETTVSEKQTCLSLVEKVLGRKLFDEEIEGAEDADLKKVLVSLVLQVPDSVDGFTWLPQLGSLDSSIYRALWTKLLYGLSTGEEELEEEEIGPSSAVVSASSVSGVLCQYCGKPFVNQARLSTHLSRWCKKVPRQATDSANSEDMAYDSVGVASSPFSASSTYTALEELGLPSFPLLSAVRVGQASSASSVNSSLILNGPFICNVCGKEYALQATLAAHQTRWCKGASASTGGNPSTREDEELPEGPPFVCKYCKKEVATSQGLTVHLSRWCPGKDYGPTADLVSGFEDVAMKDEQQLDAISHNNSLEEDRKSPVPPPSTPTADEEEALLTGQSGDALVLSFSGISSACVMLLCRLQDIKQTAKTATNIMAGVSGSFKVTFGGNKKRK